MLVGSCEDIVVHGKDTVSVSTMEATHISCMNAVLSGKLILPEPHPADLSFGFFYSTNSDLSPVFATRLLADKAEPDYIYSADIKEDLEPGTTYYYRSFLIAANETYYGETMSFTTSPVSAMIKTEDATDVDVTFATLNATLDLTDCNYDAIEYGFKLTPQGGSESTFKASDLSNKAYSYKVEPLVHDKQYDFSAYVTLDGRTYTAESKSFTTQSLKAIVTVNEATSITEFTATVTGKLTIESHGDFGQSIKICYSNTEGTVDELMANGTVKYTMPYSDGSLSFYLQGLESGTTYYYAIIANVEGVDFASEVKSFTTMDFTADVTTLDATDVKYSIATLHGALYVTSIESLIIEVWFLYSETSTTVDALKSSGIKLESTRFGHYFSSSISALKDETTYYYVACAKVHDRIVYGAVASFKTKPTAVDMGLSVKWGSFNIGATGPEECGEFYAWGETQTKSTYNGSTYSLCKGTNTTMTKYCVSSSYGIVDNKTTLEKVDDIAAQALGGSWRIPTDAEWTELRNTDNCTWTWTTENDVNGYRVTSKKTGNSIFLPAAGRRRGVVLDSAGSLGDYWSSSLYTDASSRAWLVFFSSSGVFRENSNRYEGLSVRPVCD